jgi:hypothetical protein
VAGCSAATSDAKDKVQGRPGSAAVDHRASPPEEQVNYAWSKYGVGWYAGTLLVGWVGSRYSRCSVEGAGALSKLEHRIAKDLGSVPGMHEINFAVAPFS